MKLTGRKIFKGKAKGEALVTSDSISFYGGVDPENGVVVEKGHELEGVSINDKICRVATATKMFSLRRI